MKKRKSQWGGICMLAAFGLWTVAVLFVDVQPIGPQSSMIGMAWLNGWIHEFTGVNMFLYTLTDWLSLAPVCLMMGFALLGLVQWIRRKSIGRVDRDILVLGGFYLAVLAIYLFFECFVVNRRPVLINGILEASYPSSTTVLVLCVLPVAIWQFNARIRNRIFRKCVTAAIAAFNVFMVAGRLISGVHWFTDIVGGALLSTGLVMLYVFFAGPGKQ